VIGKMTSFTAQPWAIAVDLRVGHPSTASQ